MEVLYHLFELKKKQMGIKCWRFITGSCFFSETQIFLGLFIGDGEQYTRVRQFTVRFLAQVPTAQLESVIHEEMMNLFSTIKSGSIKRVNIFQKF